MRFLLRVAIFLVSVFGGAAITPLVVMFLRDFYLKWANPNYLVQKDVSRNFWLVNSISLGLLAGIIFGVCAAGKVSRIKHTLIWSASMIGGVIGTPIIVVFLRGAYLNWATSGRNTGNDVANFWWAIGGVFLGFYIAAIFADWVITKIDESSS